MTLGARTWIWRYSAEDRRRLAAAWQHYLREACYCLMLAGLRLVARI